MSSKSIHPEPAALTSPMYFFYYRKHGLIILFSPTAFYFFPLASQTKVACVGPEICFAVSMTWIVQWLEQEKEERIATATVNHRRQPHPS